MIKEIKGPFSLFMTAKFRVETSFWLLLSFT